MHSPGSSLSPDPLHPAAISPQIPSSPHLPPSSLMTPPSPMMTSHDPACMTSCSPVMTSSSPVMMMTASSSNMMTSPVPHNLQAPSPTPGALQRSSNAGSVVLHPTNPSNPTSGIDMRLGGANNCPFPGRQDIATRDPILQGKIRGPTTCPR